MLNRLILKVIKFQLPPKRLDTVVKNILADHHAPPPPPPFQIGLNFKASQMQALTFHYQEGVEQTS